jgi:condensin complex subunit 3
VSTANHRKNAVALYKLQLNAATVTKVVKGGSAMKLTGEKAFGDAFIDALSRTLVVKKGVVVADRVAKFVATFAKFMTEKGEYHL